jgi:multidrug transporter EmrE-like cation transporter
MHVLLNTALFAAYTIASSAGLVVLKTSLPKLRLAAIPGTLLTAAFLQFAGGFALYVASFGLWLVIVARLPLSTAYPIAIGLTIAGTSVGAVLLLGEQMGPLKLAGLVMICGGTVALAMASGRAPLP